MARKDKKRIKRVTPLVLKDSKTVKNGHLSIDDEANSAEFQQGDKHVFGLDYADDDLDDDFDDDDDDSGDGEMSTNSDTPELLEMEDSTSSSRKRKYNQDENGIVEIPGKKKKKKLSSELTKPPTAEEMSRLRETENLFHSNLFRLQIDEMLRELRVKSKRDQAFSEWFSLLKNSLSEMKEGKEYEVTDQRWIHKRGICMPLKQEPEVVKGVFHFLPPSSVSLIGSYAIGCSLGPRIIADVAVEMPHVSTYSRDFMTSMLHHSQGKFFQNSDYQNERYHRKRALYLCYIAAHLIKKQIISTKDEDAPHFFLSYAGNPLIPVLEVVPNGKLESHSKVHIHLTAPQDTFKLSKLSPSKNSVRPNWFFEQNCPENEKGPATPYHNASILSDLVSNANEKIKAETIGNLQNLKDGIILLKVWLRQRELDQGVSAFGSYLMSMLVVHLVRIRRLSAHMSSYQVARTVWNFIKDSDWTTQGLTMCDDPKPGAPTLEEFHSHYSVVFVDTTGYCNLAAHMDCSSFQMIKFECIQALQFLENPNINSFHVLFMVPVPFHRQFDHILCFHNIEALHQMVSNVATSEQKLDISCHLSKLAVALLLPTLQRGLGKRVSRWGVQMPKNLHWKIGEKPSQAMHGPILIGITLDSQHAYSILDKGPSADLKEAEEFRDFWGKKSELRRFQDGSISEAVVWLEEKSVTLAQRRMVCRTISEYILQHKLGLVPGNSVYYVANQLENFLHLPQIKPAHFSYGTGEEATLAVLSSFNKLSAELRGLSDLPLDVSAIQGTSAVFRYADVFPPLATTHHAGKKITKPGKNCILLKAGHRSTMAPPWVSPVEVVIQLGLSGKWPDDAQSVRRIRAAFNIKICECLKSQCGLTAQPYPDYVDVLKDGFVFRLRVAYQREAALLRQVTLPDGMEKSVDCEEAQSLEKETMHLPRITSYLHGLHQQLPAFGPTACLAKRWMSAQMVSWTHFPEVAVELLVARLFTSPEPYCAPALPQVAFLRFLHLLSSTNWHLEPIILNFNNEMTKDAVLKIEQRFSTDRVQLPPLFIATPSDCEHSVWTKQAPSLTVLVRVALLASESLKILRECYVTPKTVAVWKQIFRPSLESYNILIWLQKPMNPRRAQWVDSEECNQPPHKLEPYKHQADEKIPVTGFDPVQCYLKELQENYDEFALFFHDYYGGNVIGVVWKPPSLETKDFKISHVSGRALHMKSDDVAPKLIINKDAIVEDFYIIGKGLVKTIDVQEQC